MGGGQAVVRNRQTPLHYSRFIILNAGFSPQSLFIVCS
jgi:hypothetical protein